MLASSESTLSIENVYSEPTIPNLEFQNVLTLRIKNKSKTSALIQYLNKNFPLENYGLYHLKRIKTIDNVVHCVVYTVSNEGEHSDLIRKWLEQVNGEESSHQHELHLLKTILEYSDVLGALNDGLLAVLQVPKHAPVLKYQWREWNKDHWPLRSYNLAETALQLAKNDPKAEMNVNSHDLESVEKCIRLVSESFNSTGLVSGLFFNPSTKTIVKPSTCETGVFLDESKQSPFSPYYKDYQCGKSDIVSAYRNRLRHCSVVGADVISQYNIEVIESLQKQGVKDENAVPYLCRGLDLYISHEPCCMCAMALLHSRIRRIYFIHPAEKFGGLINRKDGAFCVHEKPQLNHHFDVYKVKI